MASPKTLSSNLKLIDSKKTSLSKAILVLALEWKDLQSHLDSTDNHFQQCLAELESRESNLNSIRESVLQSNTDLDLIRRSIESRAQELENKEKKVRYLQEIQIRELELREERLKDEKKSMEEILERIELEREKFGVTEKCVSDRVREIGLKERYLEERSKELDSIQDWIERRVKELDSKEERLDSKEKQLNSVQNYINQSFKDFHSKNKQLKLDQKSLDELRKELELKDKRLVDLGASIVKLEQVDDADIRFVVTMDGRNLQLFLNDRWKEHETMSIEVHRALQLSMDPAKLVLDAMEGFYPPHLKKGDVEFEESVVRSSCILLLNQIMGISPNIQPRVKEEALKLAREWKVKMRVEEAGKSMEVLGFMLLVASYKLVSSFDADELLKLFEVVAEHKQATELCRVLGFTDRVPDLIENFVKKNQHLVAVTYIFAFELVDKFPPVPLLKDCVLVSKKVAQNIRNVGNNSCDAQDRATDERVASMRAVIKCITAHNLGSEYSPKSLEQCIANLLLHKERNKKAKYRNKQIKPVCLSKSLAQQYSDNKSMSCTYAPVHSKASTFRCSPTTRTMAHIIAKMNGKCLQLFLNEHLYEHDLIRNDVSDALRLSSDSGRLVLDAVQEFYCPHSKKGGIDIEASVIRRSCIFLLELLMLLSPEIKPQVKVAAMKLAIDWKENTVVEAKNPLVILGFLLLVATYELTSTFDAEELLNLFQTVSKHRLAPELSRALGLSKKFPVSNILHSEEKIGQSMSENLQLNSTTPSSSVSPQHSLEGEVPDSIRFASDPAKLVLDAIQGCYLSNLEAEKSCDLKAMKSCIPLLRQLLGISLEVKTNVKEAAMKFAADWKTEVVEKRRNPLVWCFLLFLVAFKLTSSCNRNELLGLLEIVYDRKQAIHVFRPLGLAEEVPNFIRGLIGRKQYMVAVRYIYEFDLNDNFPPVPLLLKRHLNFAKKAAKKICAEPQNSLQAQNMATRREITALKEVINCIRSQQLEWTFSPENLQTRLQQLLSQKKNRRHNAQPPPFKARPAEEKAYKRTSMPSSASKAQPQEEAHWRAVVPSPTSKSETLLHDGKKRSAPAPDRVSDNQSEQHNVKRLCRSDISPREAPNALVGTACPIQPNAPVGTAHLILPNASLGTAHPMRPNSPVTCSIQPNSPVGTTHPIQSIQQPIAPIGTAHHIQLNASVVTAHPVQPTQQPNDPLGTAHHMQPTQQPNAPIGTAQPNASVGTAHSMQPIQQPNAPIGTAHPIQPIQHPYQHAPFAAQTAPYPRPQPGHYSLEGTTPVPSPPHMSNLTSQHRPGNPTNGGFPPFGITGSTQFSSPPNVNGRPFVEAGTPYYSWSVPHRTGHNDFWMH